VYKTSKANLHPIIKLDYFWIDYEGNGHCGCDDCNEVGEQ